MVSLLAQTAFDPGAFLPSLAAQSPLVAVLVWMMIARDKAEQKRSDELSAAVAKQGVAIDRLARSVLVLSLRLGGKDQGNAEAMAILRDIGEQTPR